MSRVPRILWPISNLAYGRPGNGFIVIHDSSKACDMVWWGGKNDIHPLLSIQ